MKTETKFNVNDLVKGKFDSSFIKESVQALMIMEVITQTCYCGTQTWYLCKAIAAVKEKEGYGKDASFHWERFHSVGKADNETGWRKYREDELVELDKESIDIVTGIIK